MQFIISNIFHSLEKFMENILTFIDQYFDFHTVNFSDVTYMYVNRLNLIIIHGYRNQHNTITICLNCQDKIGRD